MTTIERPGAKANAKADGFSPGDIEVVWSRLLSIMDEAAATMIRTACSITIRESKDLAVVVFDRHGRALAESAIASPSFIGTLPRTLDAFLAEYPAADWREGDLVITNDPWIGSGHLQDITMAAPILAGRTLVGFVAISAHGPDIGGTLYSALSREIFEEGLRIPVTRYARGGRRDPIVKRFITSNVRVPDKVIGDLEGMAACCRRASRQVVELAGEYGEERYERIAGEIVARSTRAIRTAIEAAPRGTWTSEVTAAGFDAELAIRCRITLDGEGVTVDYEGTASAQPLGINVPYCYTYAHTVYPLKCVFGPAIPNNHGTAAPFTVVGAGGLDPQPGLPGRGERPPPHRAVPERGGAARPCRSAAGTGDRGERGAASPGGLQRGDRPRDSASSSTSSSRAGSARGAATTGRTPCAIRPIRRTRRSRSWNR